MSTQEANENRLYTTGNRTRKGVYKEDNSAGVKSCPHDDDGQSSRGGGQEPGVKAPGSVSTSRKGFRLT